MHPNLSPIAPACDLADVPAKIGSALAKERRAAFSVLGSVSPEQMHNGNHYSNGVESVRIWKARNFIEEHCSEEISLPQVAKVANTSANYFSEKFKEATGTNFVHYVARKRFERAAALLSDRDLRVSEIAFATGFQSLSQFNRVFRKFAGKSPTEYRHGTVGEVARSISPRRP